MFKCILYVFVASNFLFIVNWNCFCLQNAVPETCPADLGGKCGEDGEWEGEFFPGIPKIKYEVKELHPLQDLTQVLFVAVAEEMNVIIVNIGEY